MASVRWLTARQVFLNIVLDEAVEEKAGGEKVRIGMVVRALSPARRPCGLPGDGRGHVGLTAGIGHQGQLGGHAGGGSLPGGGRGLPDSCPQGVGLTDV
jgi:hypothetical protein